MSLSPSDGEKIKITRILPWFHFSGALLVLVLSALYSAVHSTLGREISAGESPGFAWIRANLITGTGLALVYLILMCWIQLRQMRQSSFRGKRLLPFLVCLQLIGVAVTALMLFFRQTEFLSAVYSVLLIVILIQGVIAFRHLDLPDFDHLSLMLKQPVVNPGPFLILLFIFGAAISFLDPSWHRMTDQTVLDTNFEFHLKNVLPFVLSGITSVWLGIGMLIIIIGISRLSYRFFEERFANRTIVFMIFFFLVAVFSAFLLLSLSYAIYWQIQQLDQESTVWQMLIFMSVTGAILLTRVFYKIIPYIPQSRLSGLIGIAALTFGATIVHPISRLWRVQRSTKTTWILLLILTLGACVFIGYGVLFGDLFNPWFTAFSYLKGAILKILSVVAAGTSLLLLEQLFSPKLGGPSNFRRLGAILAITLTLSFSPFYILAKYPEVKVVLLQFNELTRVNATFARDFADTLGFGNWMNLGQRPPSNNSPNPWPQPWRLNRTHPSHLPEGFNLLVIVVDALRGDAFHSAGYRRNLTPFLDHWAAEEAISFRRAYSQGGGSFAAFPFLVAGRSRFELYGPELYQQNVYFKLAQAEGIEHYMLMKGFGPRHIFPPEMAVTELSIPRVVSDRQSATADEVFASARNAIGTLPTGERFLCFLHLMDVHNDLWKKEGGMDFGDTPRDLYDNNLSYIDRALSRFVSWLKEEGIYDRTVILFTSDHGEQFWEHGASLHGHTVYEEEIRIPLILVAHGIRKNIADVPAIAADMAPTIVDLAGYSIDPPYDDPHMGISLVPLVLAQERERYLNRDVVGRASFKRRYFLYRNWEWKLVYFAELDLLQLFNVVKDPLEKDNLLTEEPELAAELERALLDYLEKVEGKTYRPTLSQR